MTSRSERRYRDLYRALLKETIEGLDAQIARLERCRQRLQAAAQALTSADVFILQAMARRHPKTTFQADLEADALTVITHFSRKTIGLRLAVLRGWELTHRPHGPRKGDVLTPLGLRTARGLQT
jgi:hypothetical protein